MSAIDTNLYNYLDDRWRAQYDSWSNNPAGYQNFADVMASSAEGQLYLDQLFSSGAISASMYGQEASGTDGQTADTAAATASQETSSASTQGAATPVDNFYDFTTGQWQAYNVGKMELYNQEPGLGVFLAENPEYGSLFVSGTVEQAAAVCAVYERAYYGEAYDPGQLDITT